MQVSCCVFESYVLIENSLSQVALLLTVELIRCTLTISLIVILARLLNYENRSLRSSAQLVELQSCANAS